jgi:bifunctional non-homologous end joining protein LigD
MAKSAPKALAEYNAKRDFTKTAEPKGTVARQAGTSFVVQKHAASRLHYDFRLELDGVLKSWAVSRGPSLVPGEKRLAVHVEDHPLDYGGFEGTIPKGEYGGGTVMLWDRGTWEAEGDPRKEYAKGRLTFRLDGEKLNGRWHLVRMRRRSPAERNEQWLLIKSDDAFARTADEPDLLEEAPLSVLTGRSLDEIAEGKLTGPNVWTSNRPAAGEVEGQAQKQAAMRKPARRKPAARKGAKKAAPRKTTASRKATPRKA